MRAWRYGFIWLGCGVVIALSIWLRYGWIENPAAADACYVHARSIGCMARTAAVVASQAGWLSIAAIVVGVLALLWKHPLSALLAVAVGGVAITLHSDLVGAGALLIGVLRLMRLQLGSAGSAPGQHHRYPDQHVAERP